MSWGRTARPGGAGARLTVVASSHLTGTRGPGVAGWGDG